jgi:hypothetical protein
VAAFFGLILRLFFLVVLALRQQDGVLRAKNPSASSPNIPQTHLVSTASKSRFAGGCGRWAAGGRLAGEGKFLRISFRMSRKFNAAPAQKSPGDDR